MRIAYLCTDQGVPWGGMKGASVHVAELVSAFASEGASVLVIAATVAEGAEPPPRGVTVERLPGPGKGTSVAERLAAESTRVRWLTNLLSGEGLDLLYERFALHSAAGSTVARLLHVPHFVEMNAPLAEEAARYRTLEEPEEAGRLEQIVLNNADRVFAVSRPLADYVGSRGADHVEVLPNAVALERFPPPARKEGPVSAAFVGTLRPWHGLETIAAAWEIMGPTAPDLLVIGDGPGREDLERAGARVTGALPHAAVPAVLQGADIGLAPYAPDAPRYFSPLKLFEYLAAGLAVVAADLPGVSDIVGPETAVLVPAGDPVALAAAVSALAEDAEWRRRLGRAGRELVAARHTWAHRARHIMTTAADLAHGAVIR